MKKLVSILLLASILAWGVTAPNGNALAASPTGWKHVSGHWYYYTTKGKTTGWLFNGGKWYYLNASGAMATGWVFTGGKWYYLNASGAMATGWVFTGGKWYYLNAGGAMLTGWQTIGGKQYYLYPSGAMAANTTISGKKIGSDGAVVRQSSPATPIEKAISDAQAFGGIVTYVTDKNSNRYKSYEIRKNHTLIGYFYNGYEGTVAISKQYPDLAKQLALDLGVNKTPAELQNLVNKALQAKTSSIFATYANSCFIAPIDSTTNLYIYIVWNTSNLVSAPDSLVTNTLHDLQSMGCDVKTNIDGYDIFKNSVWVASFSPSTSTTLGYLLGNVQEKTLFEKVAQDLGYSSPNGSLESIVEQVISAPKDQYGHSSLYGVDFDGTDLFTMIPIPTTN